MAPKASEIADEIVKSRDLYLAGLSERTRTLCIGALALIWGLFSQKPSEHAFDVTLTWKRTLLAIGLCAIAVLVLDFVEYACAYQFRQRVLGERVWGKIPYEKLEVAMRSAKIILGSISLAALCISLSIILATPLFAWQRPPYPYFGTWCGGTRNDGTFTCIKTTQDFGKTKIQLSYQDKDWIGCQEPTQGGLKFTTHCGRATITISTGENSPLSMAMAVGRSYEVTHSLYKWPPH